MPLPRGTYPIGGPVVLTGERPAATEALYDAGAIWGDYFIRRSGSPGSYAYAWEKNTKAATDRLTTLENAGAATASADAAQNRREAPALALERLYTIGDFTLIAFNQTAYDAGTISAGEIMVTDSALANGNHGILLGFTDATDPVFDYAREIVFDGRTAGPLIFEADLAGGLGDIFDGTIESAAPSGTFLRFEISSFSAHGSRSVGDSLTIRVGNLINAEFAGLSAALSRVEREGVAAVAAASDIQYREIADSAGLTTFIAAQRSSAKPTLALFTAAVTGVVIDGLTFNFPANQVAYWRPRTNVPTRFFILPSGGGGGGTPLLLQHDAQAGTTNLVRNTWTTVATLTIPAGDAPGAIALLFEGTATRTSGAGTINVRLRRGTTIIKASAPETEISGAVEHKPIVVMAVDTPGTAADAVYTVQANFSSNNLAANIGASQFIALGGSVEAGQTEADVDNRIARALAHDLPPFADIKLDPGGLPDTTFPDDFYVQLTGRITSRTLSNIQLAIGGRTYQPHSSTPIAPIANAREGLVRFDISAHAEEVSTNASGISELMILTFSFTEGDNYVRRIDLPINNPAFAVPEPDLSTVEAEIDALQRRNPTAVTALAYAANVEIDFDDGLMRAIALGGDVTFTFANARVSDVLVLQVSQDGTGGRGVTWPSAVEWPGGSAEGPSAGANAVDVYTLLVLSAGRIVATALLNVS